MLNKLIRISITTLLLFVASTYPAYAQPDHVVAPRWVIENVLASDFKPFAIGHRGFGGNLGENPDKPIENTTESVRQAFRAGVQIVEVDVVLTKDNLAVALHDDFLEDYTCVNQLTFAELRHRFKQASKLKHVLKVARGFSVKKNSDRPSGQVILEIKTPAPLCDPGDTTVPALVSATLAAVNQTKMQQQVLVESFSPEVVAMVKANHPSIPRALSFSLLQALTPEQLESITGLPVTLLDKNVGFGLQWVEVGPVYRVPIYESIYEYISTLVALESRAATLDKDALLQMEMIAAGSAALLNSQLHNIGISSLAYTVNDESEWLFLTSIGVDGFYTDEVLMGLSLETQ